MDDFIMGTIEATKELGLPFVSESIWTEAMTDIFFRGGRSRSGSRVWNEDDEFAPITSTTLTEQWINYALIDLEFNKIEDKSISDKGPINNFGILIDDYKIKYGSERGDKFETNKPAVRTKIGKKKKDKSY